MTAQKLPKLKYLRVKNLAAAETPQAVQLLTRLLSCWSSNGVNSEACKEIQQEFKLAASKSVSMKLIRATLIEVTNPGQTRQAAGQYQLPRQATLPQDGSSGQEGTISNVRIASMYIFMNSCELRISRSDCRQR